jgi:hypothetical protein
VALMSLFLLSNCVRSGPVAPQRSFQVDELLVNQDVMPSAWVDVWGPSYKSDDDSRSTESATITFGVSGRDLPIQARHSVRRLPNAEIARRWFEKGYLPGKQHRTPPSEWTYESSVADQSFFSYFDRDEHSVPACEWAGQYEEYIVILWMRLTPEEASLADFEKALTEIDTRMAHYLAKPLEGSEVH